MLDYLGGFFKGRLYNFLFRMTLMTFICFCRYVLCLCSRSRNSVAVNIRDICPGDSGSFSLINDPWPPHRGPNTHGILYECSLITANWTTGGLLAQLRKTA